MNRIEPPNVKPADEPPCPKCGSNDLGSPYWLGAYRWCNACNHSWCACGKTIVDEMASVEAVARLRDMQAQIIHGKNTFGEIADCIEKLQAEVEALKRDKERLEHLINTGDYISFRDNSISTSTGWVCHDALARWTSAAFETPREAIDHAIRNHTTPKDKSNETRIV